jgi:soluble lytic murein transglycosylase-like protein
VSAYLPAPDARRIKSEHGLLARPAARAARPASVFAYPAMPEAKVAPEAPVPTGGGARRAAHRALPKPTVRGNTVVSATAALGAVVTGSFMASQPGFDAPSRVGAHAELASATQPLLVQPVNVDSAMNEFHPASVSAAMLPVALPADREAAVDQRDVEALHKGEELAAHAARQHALAVHEARILAGGGDLDDWIAVALAKMNLNQSLAPGVRSIIMAESRGNPHAVNHYDSNARAGRPSQGLMQVIPSTFRAYVLPELADMPITNPVANITAGVRYMIANYGMSTVRNGGRTDRAGNYVGY